MSGTPSSKSYHGWRESNGDAVVDVIENDKDPSPLNPRNDIDNHSPDGFEWGYGGSGPAQLALALIADATGKDSYAQVLHQDFKFKYITTLPQKKEWHMSAEEVRKYVEELLRARPELQERIKWAEERS
jgi:hypothetical protein